MRNIKISLMFRYFWVVLAFHILNISIDAPDAKPDSFSEDLNFNDIESIAELVLEGWLGIQNIVPEHDEPDDQDGNSLEMKKVDFFYQQASLKFQVFYPLSTSVKFYNQNKPFCPERYLPIFSPPPEV
jgi:hypothetical protein